MIAGGSLLMMEGAARVSGLGGIEALPVAHIFLVPLSLVLIAAWGYVVNDILDEPADRANQRRRPLVTGVLGASQARNAANVLLIASLASIVAATLWLPLYAFLLLFAAFVLVWAYNPLFQRVPLLAAATTAILVSLTVIIPAVLVAFLKNPEIQFSDKLKSFLLVYASFAFLTTLVREQAKDMQDLQGDSIGGKRSLAVALGWTKAKWILLACMLILTLLMLFVAKALWDARMHNVLFVGAVFVAVPILMSLRFALMMSEPGDAATLSITYKWLMVAGLLTVFFL
jgi:4-hydroxybenzoate polyprenyltransferase